LFMIQQSKEHIIKVTRDKKFTSRQYQVKSKSFLFDAGEPSGSVFHVNVALFQGGKQPIDTLAAGG